MEESVSGQAPYDAIFIDAAKGQYQRFFELYSSTLVRTELSLPTMFCLKGLLLNQKLNQRRIRNLVKKINDFNHWLMNHPDYDTVILPVGDGVAISKKR